MSGASRFAAKRKSRTTARSAEAVEAVGGVDAAAFASVMLGWRASEQPFAADGKAPQESIENRRRVPPRFVVHAVFTRSPGAPVTGPNEPHLAPPPHIAPLCTLAENLRLSCPVRAMREKLMVIALMTCITPLARPRSGAIAQISLSFTPASSHLSKLCPALATTF